MCHIDEWDSIWCFYDHSWGQLNKASESLSLSESLGLV